MRISQRELKANIGKNKLQGMIFEQQTELDLTDVELLQALVAAQQAVLKYMLRYERHGDYDTPAGVESE